MATESIQQRLQQLRSCSKPAAAAALVKALLQELQRLPGSPDQRLELTLEAAEAALKVQLDSNTPAPRSAPHRSALCTAQAGELKGAEACLDAFNSAAAAAAAAPPPPSAAPPPPSSGHSGVRAQFVAGQLACRRAAGLKGAALQEGVLAGVDLIVRGIEQAQGLR